MTTNAQVWTAQVVGNNLIITLPINRPLVPSATGKTRVVASTHGNHPTTAIVEGKPVIVGVNAYIGK